MTERKVRVGANGEINSVLIIIIIHKYINK